MALFPQCIQTRVKMVFLITDRYRHNRFTPQCHLTKLVGLARDFNKCRDLCKKFIARSDRRAWVGVSALRMPPSQRLASATFFVHIFKTGVFPGHARNASFSDRRHTKIQFGRSNQKNDLGNAVSCLLC
jgi:hypothetical protein